MEAKLTKLYMSALLLEYIDLRKPRHMELRYAKKMNLIKNQSSET